MVPDLAATHSLGCGLRRARGPTAIAPPLPQPGARPRGARRADQLATLVALVGAIILSVRVEETQTKKQDENARDIMLCLDASGSMAPYNVDVLEEMQDIVKGLEGERIGLAIWSKATITVFPLTDDYDYALEKLEEAEEAFEAIEDIRTSRRRTSRSTSTSPPAPNGWTPTPTVALPDRRRSCVLRPAVR